MKKPPEAPAHYPIRAVSRLTGIGIDTLRAWERRHSAITPIRDDRGRMYTEANIARLRLLRGAVEHGHSIGRLAGLSDKELRNLAQTAGAIAAPAPDPMRRTSLDAAALSTALDRFDAAGIDQEIARLAVVLRPVELVRDVLMPMLVRVGDDWHTGRGGVSHEHLMSSTIRNILGSFLRLHARPDVPARLLFATPSGDRHEIGTLGAAMLAAASGLGVAYFGPDLPARDIVESVKPAGAQVLVLGLTTASAAYSTVCLSPGRFNPAAPYSFKPSPHRALASSRTPITPAVLSLAPVWSPPICVSGTHPATSASGYR